MNLKGLVIWRNIYGRKNCSKLTNLVVGITILVSECLPLFLTKQGKSDQKSND